jgi:hypothetical protein
MNVGPGSFQHPDPEIRLRRKKNTRRNNERTCRTRRLPRIRGTEPEIRRKNRSATMAITNQSLRHNYQLSLCDSTVTVTSGPNCKSFDIIICQVITQWSQFSPLIEYVDGKSIDMRRCAILRSRRRSHHKLFLCVIQ